MKRNHTRKPGIFFLTKPNVCVWNLGLEIKNAAGLHVRLLKFCIAKVFDLFIIWLEYRMHVWCEVELCFEIEFSCNIAIPFVAAIESFCCIFFADSLSTIAHQISPQLVCWPYIEKKNLNKWCLSWLAWSLNHLNQDHIPVEDEFQVAKPVLHECNPRILLQFPAIFWVEWILKLYVMRFRLVLWCVVERSWSNLGVLEYEIQVWK